MGSPHGIARGTWGAIFLVAMLLAARHGAAEEKGAFAATLLGLTRAEIIEQMGEPEGVIVFGDTEILQFPRGTVDLQDGRAIKASVMSRQEAEIEEKERLAREEQMREAAEARRLALIRDGEAEKERILADPAYTNKSAREMVTFWNEFSAKYPDVPIDQQSYDTAMQKQKEEEEFLRRAKAADEEKLPPPPDISSKKKRKLKRAGKWKWD